MPRFTARQVALAKGFRSGLEEALARQLAGASIKAAYEELSIPFEQPVKARKYTPDFILPNGIIIESKGRFETQDRQKHLMVQQQHPDLDIRFVFSNPSQRISKTSKTTYAAWCEHRGFKYAKGLIPEAWLREPEVSSSLTAISKLRRKA